MGIELAEATVKVTADTSKMAGTVEHESKGIFGRIGEIAGGVLGANLVMAGAEGLKKLFEAGVDEAKESSMISAQFAAGITSTGNAANLSVKGMNELASSVSAYSGQSVSSIGKTEQVLQTFVNLKNVGPDKIFDGATVAAANMAAKMGGDASTSAIQLGIALNDPIKGVARLHRVGVAFTKAQTDQIKAMQDSGNLMGAQKIILAELSTEFGGAAKAAGETWPGALNRIKSGVKEMAGTVVNAGSVVMLPALNAVANGIGKLKGPVDAFSEHVTGAFAYVKGYISGTGSDVEVGKWEKPLGVIADIVIKFKGAIKTTLDAVKPVFATVGKTIGDILPSITPLVPQVINLFSAFSPLTLILKSILPVLPIVANLFSVVAKAIGGELSVVLPIITNLMSSLIGILSGVFAQVLPIVVELVTSLAGVMGKLLPVIADVAKVLSGVLLTVFKALVPVIAPLAKIVVTLVEALMPLIPPILKIVEAFLPLIAVVGKLIATILPPLITLLMAVLDPILALITPLVNALAPILVVVADIISKVVVVAVNVLGAVFSWLGGVIGLIAKGIGIEIQIAGDVISAVFSFITDAVNFVAAGFSSAFSGIVGAVQFVGKVFSNVFGGIAGFVQSAFSNAVGFVRTGINGVIGIVNGAIGALDRLKVTVPDWVPLIGGQTWGLNIPTIPMLASGSNDSPDTFIAGEKGPELVTGARGSTVRPYSATKDLLARAGNEGGVQYHFATGSVVLDAHNVKDWQDVIDMLKALPQVARSGHGSGNNGKAA
jgi:phage-related protein